MRRHRPTLTSLLKSTSLPLLCGVVNGWLNPTFSEAWWRGLVVGALVCIAVDWVRRDQ